MMKAGLKEKSEAVQVSGWDTVAQVIGCDSP